MADCQGDCNGLVECKTKIENMDKKISRVCKSIDDASKDMFGKSTIRWGVGILFTFILGAYSYTGAINVWADKKLENQHHEISQIDRRVVETEKANSLNQQTLNNIDKKLDTILRETKEIKKELRDHGKRIDRLEWGQQLN